MPGKILLRHTYRLLTYRRLTVFLSIELLWWLDASHHWNERELSHRPIECQLITDASYLEWGVVLKSQVGSDDWNLRVSKCSTNYRELLAILMALKTTYEICSVIERQRNCYSIRESPRKPQSLSSAASNRYLGGSHRQWCAHVVGRMNWHTVNLSRTIDKHNWMSNPKLFWFLDRLRGPRTIDCFANCQNAQVPRFNSRLGNHSQKV